MDMNDLVVCMFPERTEYIPVYGRTLFIRLDHRNISLRYIASSNASGAAKPISRPISKSILPVGGPALYHTSNASNTGLIRSPRYRSASLLV